MISFHIRRAIHLLALTCLLVIPSVRSAQAAGDITILVSVNADGVPGDSSMHAPSVSENGRYIAFASYASSLAPGDTNNASDIFVRDTQTGVTTLVSVSSDETLSNGDSFRPSISADGRYVAFESVATNLVDQDQNPYGDIFIRDLQTGTTILASVDSSGEQATSLSEYPSISADGRYVTFHAGAALVSEDVNGDTDVFVRDIVDRTTRLVSVNSSGAQGNSFSHFASISPDGQHVAFLSYATNLVDGDSNKESDVFLRDLQAGTTMRVSVGEGEANGVSSTPAVSLHGRYVVFSSEATNLVYGDTNNVRDVFIRDTVAGTTSRLSVSSEGTQGTDSSESPRISSDGRYVTFTSSADNLVAGDTNTFPDAFVHDTISGTTRRVSVDSSGLQGNYLSWGSDISSDGGYVAFVSWATNLVDTTIEQGPQVFSHGPYSGPTLPGVLSSNRSSPNPTSAASVDYTVTFSEPVTGVDSSDFSLHVTGSLTGAAIGPVAGSGSVYTVTVHTGSGNGTIRLDVVDDDSILDGSGFPLGGVGSGNGNYTGGQVYTVDKNPTFVDVPTSHPYYTDIEILYANGLTGGCSTSPMKYCPDQIMDRAMASVFMVRGAYGAGYVPKPAAYKFKDNWSKSLYARPWAEAMREANLTTGCKALPLLYCPLDRLNREQAVIFGLKMKYGNYYLPPPATGTVFADMTNPNYWAAPWVEKAYADGLITACGQDAATGKPKFCPKTLVTRGLGAYIIVRAKDLTMP